MATQFLSIKLLTNFSEFSEDITLQRNLHLGLCLARYGVYEFEAYRRSRVIFSSY